MECGIAFNAWEKGGALEEHSSTRLTGEESRTLLHTLPSKLKGVLHADTEEDVVLFWKQLVKMLSVFDTDQEDVHLTEETRVFMETFVRLGSTARRGYGEEAITPEMHVLCHHAPSKHVEFKCLGRYSGSGLEPKHYHIKQLHHANSTKWNALADVMKLAKRMEHRDAQKLTRKYVKSDRGYWWKGSIGESRKRRVRPAARRRAKQHGQEDDEDCPSQEMTDSESSSSSEAAKMPRL